MGALAKAMEGEKKLSDGQKSSALNEAVERLKRLGRKVEGAKETMEAGMEAAVATAEIQGAVLVGSSAEGYWGEEKMDVGPVDVRLGAGLLTAGYGFYKVLTGEEAGSHFLALGNGLLATGIGRLGRKMGQALREKGERAAGGAANNQLPNANNAPAPAPAMPAPQPVAAGALGDAIRNLVLSDGSAERATPGRFVRARMS